MAPKNLEEAFVERIQRALAKELKQLRQQRRRATGNGHVHDRSEVDETVAMPDDYHLDDTPGGTA
jgi:hypothetical protein